ncbi:hypothetical protein K4A87_07500 [Xanthomonas fragariae]|uniref:hypothetical protein n=1 Tax=Xanthomonas fragariae TaxID=48664 RepID=UPI001ABDFAD9|nr:hypothetical protein [Xanthomonas fragariae]UKR52815.1 hypothetical protein K4A87_01415 [Xanthomonas fragariae]UKR53702.1 hypothetical protein K4A87_07500 [Xanthomonas fragariae]
MLNKQPTDQLHVHAAALTALRQRQLPVMHTCQAELAHGVGQLQTKGKMTATLIYAWYGLETLADAHAATLRALTDEHDSGAQMLAQGTIEMAVDVLYLLGDLEGDRIAAALRHHIDAQIARFKAWQVAQPEETVASQWADKLASDSRKTSWYADAAHWPGLGARADAAGVGRWVHPVMASAANATQLLAAGTQNYLLCEQGSPALRSATHAYRSARIGSDTAYMEAVALSLFARALHAIATILGDKVALTIAQSAVEQMDTLLAEHQTSVAAQQNDDNLYIKLF